MKAKCPICKKAIEHGQKAGKPQWLPFCSQRCKLIDLGKWLDSSYRIPVEPEPSDEQNTEDSGGDESEDI
jgi:endogenous inhibitor of DNA gyrase (YacG/DUF329 family)